MCSYAVTNCEREKGLFGEDIGVVVPAHMISIVDGGRMIERVDGCDGSYSCAIVPLKRDPVFTAYWAYVSPESKKIYSIVARADFEDKEDLFAKANELVKLPEEKYKRHFKAKLEEGKDSSSVKMLVGNREYTIRTLGNSFYLRVHHRKFAENRIADEARKLRCEAL